MMTKARCATKRRRRSTAAAAAVQPLTLASVMAAQRATDPDIDAMVESIRDRLMRAPDRAGALRYVHFVLGAWNGEGLPADEPATTPRHASERCPDCAQHGQRFVAFTEIVLPNLLRRAPAARCPAHEAEPYNFPPVGAHAPTREEPTTTPEDTLREAGISSKRQVLYQRRMSSLLGGHPEAS
jgi:hypothetical protein